MAEEEEETEKPAKKGGGAITMVLGIVLPALVAAGAAFGGVKLGMKGMKHAQEEQTEQEHPHMRPPGPTSPLDPFLIALADANQKSHPMKLTLQIELFPETKPDDLKPFMPRTRDALNSMLRAHKYEQLSSREGVDKLRQELIEELRKLGVTAAEKVLITDLVLQ